MSYFKPIPFRDYRNCTLCEGKEWTITYYVMDPDTQRLKRMRIGKIVHKNAKINLYLGKIPPLCLVDAALIALTVTPALVVLDEGLLREALDAVLALEEEHAHKQ